MPFGNAREPSAAELRYFGLVLAAILGVLGAAARWRWHAPSVAAGVWSVAVAAAVAYYALPSLRRPLVLVWRAALRPMERAVSSLTLAIVYYVVFAPVGLLLRAAGRDSLERRFDAGAASYFAPRRTARDSARHFRQY